MTVTAEPVARSRQAALVAEVDRVRSWLQQGRGTGDREPLSIDARPIDASPIDAVAACFGLSAFERHVLALTAAVELDGDVAALVAEAQGGTGPRPTFALALGVLPAAHWDAMAPASPLRRWHLVELGAGPTLASRPLALDERILHHLTGAPSLDARLAGIVREPGSGVAISPSQEARADELLATVGALGRASLVALDGDDVDGRVATTFRLAAGLGGSPVFVSGAALPGPGPDLALTATLLDRELRLTGGLPVVEPSAGAEVLAHELCELLEAEVVVLLGDAPPARPGRVTLRRSVPYPSPTEQLDLWRRAVGSRLDPDDNLDGDLDDDLRAAVGEVAQHYRLGADTIDSIGRELASGPPADADLHLLCRTRCRVNLDGLAERIDADAGWDDLVLPPGQLELLHDLVRQVRHRHQVYEQWGFAGPTRRGLGVTALFSGDSGTGKTLAAQVLAGVLELDLYRVDLSATVSKYIGETEKNLQRLFDAAEASGAVLLFDEADALFGKRGEVKQAHDRYANLEVAYLLGRMESYRGLALLTTNLRGNLDRAFLRRLRFVVQFPFPDEAQRALIWRRMFPPGAPTKGLDPQVLARLTVAGGAIRSIAVAAAFAAADEGSPITPAHVLRAAEIEYAKVERSLTDVERGALT